MLYEVITHSVKVYDLQTLETWEELFPYDYADRITSYNVCYTKLLRNMIQAIR